jgi:CDP-glycerol glycerophosphotransferase (TagB/SpsB family)
MVKGADWKPEKVNIGGIPSYDGYIQRKWLIPKEEYFKMHGLDPDRKLISYASSFVTFSPNIQNVEALITLIKSDRIAEPSQLLIRLHPTHYLDVDRYVLERKMIQDLADTMEHVHVVEPVSLGGGMGYYSGEDMPEKSSMMAYSDVMVTVYSTMVVEASVHGTPVVSLCIDSPNGWPGKYTLPLSEIGDWPTHQRFRESMSGREATDQESLLKAVNHYLRDPNADVDARHVFLKKECSYLDGTAGRRTADFILSIMNKSRD